MSRAGRGMPSWKVAMMKNRPGAWRQQAEAASAEELAIRMQEAKQWHGVAEELVHEDMVHIRSVCKICVDEDLQKWDGMPCVCRLYRGAVKIRIGCCTPF